MKTILNKLSLGTLLLASTLFLASNSFAGDVKISAGEAAIHAKLEKCEVAFSKAHSGKLSQKDAYIARREHKKLTKEILADLNKRNAEVSLATGEALSNEEILTNFKVMGRLLEMLASENVTDFDEWGYDLVR